MTERVLIAVCTRRRPQMLAQCLRSLARLQPPPAGMCVQVLVVENDDDARMRAQVDVVRPAFPWPLDYVQEPRAGLSYARNRALEASLLAGVDWLAFIDDDEQAEPQWLAELCRVAQAYVADVVRGPVRYHYPPQDRWAHLRETGRKVLAPEGQVIKEGATNNVLLNRRLFANDGLGLSFDLRLNFTGGEDKLFFMQAIEAGAKLVFAPEAYVHETVPIERCSLKMLWRNKARMAANAIYIERDIVGRPSVNRFYLRQIRKECRVMVVQIGRSLSSCFVQRGQAHHHFLKAWLSMARIQGMVSGLLRRWDEGYRDVQGY